MIGLPFPSTTTGLVVALSEGGGGSFLDGLPDPMKPNPLEIGFVVILVTLLYLVLKATFFKPVLSTMDARDQQIEEGTRTRSDAAALVAERQAAYQSQLKEIRSKAFERKKALAEASLVEKHRLLEETRSALEMERQAALAKLQAQHAAARQELITQVGSLSDALVSTLLKA